MVVVVGRRLLHLVGPVVVIGIYPVPAMIRLRGEVVVVAIVEMNLGRDSTAPHCLLLKVVLLGEGDVVMVVEEVEEAAAVVGTREIETRDNLNVRTRLRTPLTPCYAISRIRGTGEPKGSGVQGLTVGEMSRVQYRIVFSRRVHVNKSACNYNYNCIDGIAYIVFGMTLGGIENW